MASFNQLKQKNILNDKDTGFDLAVKKILIVDDDRDFAQITGQLLAVSDYEVDLAYSEEGVLEKLKEFHPHVALVDIYLGKQNGFDLISTLNKLTPKVLTVLVTAYPQKSFSVEALKKGAYDILFKPFDPIELLHTLQRCFEKIQLENINAKLEKGLEEAVEIFDIEKIGDSIKTYAKDIKGGRKNLDLDQINGLLNKNKSNRINSYLEKIGLTPREIEICHLITDSMNNQEISKLLFISLETVKTHIKSIFQKLGVKSRLKLISYINSK